MKKRVLSVLLAFAVCMGLTTDFFPIFGSEEDISEIAPHETEEEVTEDPSVEEPSGFQEDLISTEDVYPEIDYLSVLFEQMMNCQNFEEFVSVLDAVSEEQYEQFSEEQKAALEIRWDELSENVEMPELITQIFTDAGPLKDPVYVGSSLRRTWSASQTASDTDTGISLDKKAKYISDGEYELTLEAFTTGEVIDKEITVPVDIVLVLDVSSSMDKDFNGKATTDNTKTRMYALKNAATSFVESVHEKYTENSDNRIAIVTFDYSAHEIASWTYANDQGTKDLKTAIANIKTGKETNPAEGLEMAYSFLKNESYDGPNRQRQQAVIMFTDGYPCDLNRGPLSVSQCNLALEQAALIKGAGAAMYSIGIFEGADPSIMYPSKKSDITVSSSKYTAYISTDITPGEVGFFFGSTQYFKSDGDDNNLDPWYYPASGTQVFAANRFMNLLSSNHSSATDLGLKQDDSRSTWVNGQKKTLYGYEITKKYILENDNYYLTASDSSSLEKIFQSISQQISSPKISLGSEAVLKDIVTPYFTMPDNASGYTVQVATKNKTGWNTPVSASEFDSKIAVNIDSKTNTVLVSGFDFDANFVSETPRKVNGADYYGAKLILTFRIEQIDGFLGGNDVPTNGEGSGIYTSNGIAAGTFPVPKVNIDIPVKDIQFELEDKNVYLYGARSKEQLNVGQKVLYSVNDTEVDLLNLEENDVHAQFVNVDIQYSNTDINVAEDGQYTMTCTISPVYPKADGVQTITLTKTANIYVYTPEITFKDLDFYYGEDLPDMSESVANEAWTNGENNADDEGIKMTGDRPEINYTFRPINPSNPEEVLTTVSVKDDIPVFVDYTIDDKSIDGLATIIYLDAQADPSYGPGGQDWWWGRVNTCSLTIKKTGGEANEPYVFDVYRYNSQTYSYEKYTEVTVVGYSSVTISEMMSGTYYVEENSAWNSRWTADTETVNLGSGRPPGPGGPGASQSATVTVANTKKNDKDKWLNGFASVVKNTIQKASSLFD